LSIALSWKVLLPIGVMAAYTAFLAGALRLIHLWNAQLIKETLLWFLLAAVPLLVDAVGQRDPETFFKKAVSDALKVIVVFEFLVGTYTFSLPVEIVLVPVLAFLAAAEAYAGMKPEYAGAARLTGTILAIFGLVIVGSAIARAVGDLSGLANLHTLQQVALGPLFSIAVIPLLYAFTLISQYESLFIRIGPVNEPLPGDIKWYARRSLILHLRFSAARVATFLRSHGLQLMRIRSKEDIDELLAAYRDGASTG
jgi:uncharacterized membrane protein